MCYSCLVTTQQLSQQGDNSPELIELTAGREKSNEPSSSIARNFDDGDNSISTSDLLNQVDNIKIKQKELRQLEQKLNRYAEELKLKEAMIDEKLRSLIYYIKQNTGTLSLNKQSKH
jgi:hypothetical protein